MAEAALHPPRPPGGAATARRRQGPNPALRCRAAAEVPRCAPARPGPARPALPARGAVRCGRPGARRRSRRPAGRERCL